MSFPFTSMTGGVSLTTNCAGNAKMCIRDRDYSVNINSSLLSKAMGDEKTKQWLEYNLSLIDVYKRQ